MNTYELIEDGVSRFVTEPELKAWVVQSAPQFIDPPVAGSDFVPTGSAEHLRSLEVGLSHELDRFYRAKTDSEKAARVVWIEQYRKQIADEKRYLGISAKVPDDIDAMSADELLKELEPPSESIVETPAEAPSEASEPKEEEAAEFSYNGVRVYPIQIRAENGAVETQWGVESSENKAKREAGKQYGFGDALAKSAEQAKTLVDQQVMRDGQRAAMAAEQAAAKALEDERKSARAKEIEGMSLAEIKANDFLNGPIREGATGDVIPRREWVTRRINEGLSASVRMVNKIKPMSRSAFNRANNREQMDHEKKVAAGGKIPEYSIGDYIVTKSEYDYAQKLESQRASEKENNSPSAAEAAPIAEPTETSMAGAPAAMDAPLLEDPAATEAKKFLQSVINGEQDFLDLELSERLADIGDKFESDADVMAMLNDAAMAYANAMIEQAKKAL